MVLGVHRYNEAKESGAGMGIAAGTAAEANRLF